MNRPSFSIKKNKYPTSGDRGIVLTTTLLLLAHTIPTIEATTTSPNFIIMQPDDLQFFEEWFPPAHFTETGYTPTIPAADLPNMERLRGDGVQMMQAYT